MDDYVVIILTLIIGIIGFLGKAKKRKPVQPVSENSTPPESFWDLIQGNQNQQKENMNAEEFEDMTYIEEDESVTTVQNEIADETPYRFNKDNEGISDIPDRLEEEKEKPRLKSRLREDFSLRKAVIYSEILNRKYS